MGTKTALEEFAAELVRLHALTAADLVVEVGSGDGQLLRAVRALGPRAVGVEADARLAARSWAAGADTIAAHFNPSVAEYIHARYGPARVVVTRTVRAAGEDLTDFLAVAARCLGPGGAVAIHSGSARALIELRPDHLSARAA